MRERVYETSYREAVRTGNRSAVPARQWLASVIQAEGADHWRPATIDCSVMPELPEVETIARGLAKRISGDVIESVWLGSKPEPLKSPAAEIAVALQAKRISRVWRAGKHIVFDLESARDSAASSQWLVHLGMTGSLLVCAPGLELEKHTHAVLQLASGRELRFVDPRRFGRLSVIENFEAPGAEPLQIAFDDFRA